MAMCRELAISEETKELENACQTLKRLPFFSATSRPPWILIIALAT